MRLKGFSIATGIVLAAMGVCANAQTELLLPGQGVARDVPGAQMLPDPSVEHKVVFDIATPAESVDEINPRLLGVARYVNTLGKHGVPAENRKVVVVFHRGSTPVILNNDAFKARNDGHDNPNVELIESLHAAGVEFHVCGQAVTGRNIDPAEILPEVQLDLWALTTIIDLGLQGYVIIGP